MLEILILVLVDNSSSLDSTAAENKYAKFFLKKSVKVNYDFFPFLGRF